VFKGEKTIVFWIGLIFVGLASVILFGILWIIAVWNGYVDRLSMFKWFVPFIVGSLVFILIGFYMMKSGVKKTPKIEQPSNQ